MASRRVWLGLGSNLEQPLAQLTRAIQALQALPDSRFLRCSSFYRSRPMGDVVQADFINAVAEIETTLSAIGLLDVLQGIEHAQGRQRLQHWGPRTLDIDILTYGKEKIDNARLTVPHAGIMEREFVLYPLAELAPDLEIPGLGSVTDLLRSCPRSGLKRLETDTDETAGA